MRTMLTMVNVVQIIISDIAHTVYITFTAFWNFSKLNFLLHIFDLRNFYSGDAQNANYGKRCSNHHFRHGAHCVYHIYSVLKLFDNAVCLAYFGFFEISIPVMPPCQLWWALFKPSFPTLRTLCISHLQCFKTFRNCTLFWTFWLVRNFYSGDAHHTTYGERYSNHHFRHSANCVYRINSVVKLFEIAICFPYFGFYEISTPVMRTLLTMVNVVQTIISDIAHTLSITFTVFWNSSKLQFALHIFAFAKFQLRWCAPC